MGKKWLMCAWLMLTALLCWGGVERAVPAQGSAQLTASYIALTFDDGPRRLTTTRLLDGLRERGASATFFLVGEQIEANQDLVERMEAEGHQVGNHTWSHVRLEGADAATVQQEVGQTEALLESILGPGTYWLRPPYGRIQEEQKAQIGVPLATWSIDSRDWESLDAAKAAAAILQEARPNAIILMHDIYPSSVDAALQVVDALEAEGYLFVTVEELLALCGTEAQAGTVYRCGEP